MSDYTKKDLLQSVYDDTATYVGEEWCTEDCYKQTYSYKGVTFYVIAYSRDRWLEEDPELILFGEV